MLNSGNSNSQSFIVVLFENAVVSDTYIQCWSDKNVIYFRKYIPQLSKFPTAFIYEPWKAPLKVQEKAGCIIGKDYPKPIVEHDQMRKKNIERMAKAYNSSKKAESGIGVNKLFNFVCIYMYVQWKKGVTDCRKCYTGPCLFS